jgi:hypothetical protein
LYRGRGLAASPESALSAVYRTAPPAAAIAVLVAMVMAGCGTVHRRARHPSPGPSARATRPTPLTTVQRAEITRRRAEERPHYASVHVKLRADSLPIPRRRSAVLGSLRRDVLSDARGRARSGQIRGPLIGAQCSVASEDRGLPRRSSVLRYECLAVTFRSHTKPPLMLGTPYLARVDFHRETYAFCLFVPVGGEGAHTALTFAAPPPPACAKAPD